MKTVLLIGDSIRQGYEQPVREALAGVADVLAPQENCRFAQYVLRNLHEWKGSANVPDDTDVVHWNAGLWDTLILYEEEPLTPLKVYTEFIERICCRIRLLFPRAKMIFATSTPVLEHRFPDPDTCFRKNSDIRRYNAAAAEVVLRHGGMINDLYGALESVPESFYTDMTHPYTEEGIRLLSDKVLRSVLEALGEKYDPQRFFCSCSGGKSMEDTKGL